MKNLDFTHDSMITVMTLFSLLYIKHIKVYYARFPAYNYIYGIFVLQVFFYKFKKFPFRGYSGFRIMESFPILFCGYSTYACTSAFIAYIT